MANIEQENRQPKSVLWHSSNVVDFLKQNMGMIQANALYNNEFLQASEVWKFVQQVLELINQNVIDLRKKPDLKLDRNAVEKLDKIYNGGCYLLKHYSDDYHFKIDSWTFHYEKLTNVSSDDIQQLPAMKAMNPTKTIDSKDWGISIRQTVPIKYAFSGYDYATLISQGKFFNSFSDKIVPRFEESDLNKTHLSTHDVSKNYYNNTLDVLKKFWLKNWVILFVNIHKIIEYLEKGSFQKDVVKQKLVGSDE